MLDLVTREDGDTFMNMLNDWYAWCKLKTYLPGDGVVCALLGHGYPHILDRIHESS